MKTFICFALIVFSITAYSQLSFDNEAESPIVMSGATAGVNIPQAMFNAGFNTAIGVANKKNGALFGFNISGKNRSGLSDFINNGLTASKMQFGLNIGGYFDNSYERRYGMDKSAYLAKLTSERETLEAFIMPKFFDTAFLEGIKQIIFSGSDSASNQKMWEIFQKNTYHLGQTQIDWGKLDKEKWSVREHINMCIGELYSTLIQSGVDIIELKNIDDQINNIDAKSGLYNRFSLTFTPSVSYSGISYTGVQNPTGNYVYDTTGRFIHKTAFNIKMAVNWNINKQWYIGFSLGAASYDNFYALNKVSVDSIVSTGTTKQTISYTAYNGSYTVNTGGQLGFSANYVHNFSNKSYIIYTPVYFSIGPVANFGTSLSVLLKNNLSMGVNLEAVAYNNGGAPGFSAQRNMFGFNIRYLLADLDFEK